jgi:hypothetical protein
VALADRETNLRPGIESAVEIAGVFVTRRLKAQRGKRALESAARSGRKMEARADMNPHVVTHGGF